MIFASVNAFNMITQSRRDDMISLCYFMLYLVDGDLAFLQNEEEDSDGQNMLRQEEFNKIKHMKSILTPELLCESPEGKRLLPFFKEVFSLRFTQRPDYDKLRFMLLKIMLEINQTPDHKYDWNLHVKAKKRVPLIKQESHDSCDMA